MNLKLFFIGNIITEYLQDLLGYFFLVPLIYFYFSKKIKKEYLNVCYFIFTLIILQGIVGWYMVKSGLINDVTVSHYRLSIHLIIAILIISSIFWLIKNITRNKNKIFLKFLL